MMFKNLTNTLLNFELFHSTLQEEEKNQERLNIWRRNHLRGCVIQYKILPAIHILSAG